VPPRDTADEIAKMLGPNGTLEIQLRNAATKMRMTVEQMVQQRLASE